MLNGSYPAHPDPHGRARGLALRHASGPGPLLAVLLGPADLRPLLLLSGTFSSPELPSAPSRSEISRAVTWCRSADRARTLRIADPYAVSPTLTEATGSPTVGTSIRKRKNLRSGTS